MSNQNSPKYPAEHLQEISIAELHSAMEKKELTSLELVRSYIERVAAIDWSGPNLNSIIELNPEAEDIACCLDQERKQSGPRSLLHGIPILVKDNIDTADKMLTTAGSLALVGSKPRQDAFVVQKLREAGAILFGKTNLTEWSSFRSSRGSSGWSGRGGQCRNPYILTHSPFGSSSGSAVAVSANLGVAALATETDGSIVCPAHANGIVGIKPTVGLTSRAGVVPISHSQDSVGVHARSVKDAAILLGALTGLDSRDLITQGSKGKSFSDYTQYLDKNGLDGARIGVARQVYFGYNQHVDKVVEKAIKKMRELGAIIIDPANIVTAQEIKDSADVMTVLTYEFKHDLKAYLATRVPDLAHPEGKVLKSLAEIIAFNTQNQDRELLYFGQDIFEMAEARGNLSDNKYLTALANNRRQGGLNGIDATIAKYHLDALIAPTGQPAWPVDLLNGDHITGVSSLPAAIVGYPIVTVPAGLVFGLPVGISFIGTAYNEPILIKLAYAYEQATNIRTVPQFLSSFSLPTKPSQI